MAKSRFVAKIGTIFHLPLNDERLQKLSESYVVSNAKLKRALGIEKMPVSAEEGIRRTLKSFLKEREEGGKEITSCWRGRDGH